MCTRSLASDKKGTSKFGSVASGNLAQIRRTIGLWAGEAIAQSKNSLVLLNANQWTLLTACS